MLKLTVKGRIVSVIYEYTAGYHTFTAPAYKLTIQDLNKTDAWSKFRARLNDLVK